LASSDFVNNPDKKTGNRNVPMFADKADIARALQAALHRGGDFAEVFFEYRLSESLSLEEGIFKSPSRSISQGVGVRVVSGERTGYAYSDELTPERLLEAARTASHILKTPEAPGAVRIGGAPAQRHALYSIAQAPIDADIQLKLDLLREAEAAARAGDPRICEVRLGLASEWRSIAVYNSEGVVAEDRQPLTRFMVSCIAADASGQQIGVQGGGGRVDLSFFRTHPPAEYARLAAAQAVIQLEAREAPAGTMKVVLAPGWPGILLHEAVGHGLEADFNRKNLSAFSGRIGQQVASEACTVIDDGTLPGRRGSLNVDDEGTPTSRTVLIEKGILRGYLQDHLSARLTGAQPTGNGRRESYACIPMPRMTNTFMLAGEQTPEEILRSVDRGIYAVSFSGGQVDITNGKFVFSASEAYLIEGGRVTSPIRGCTLIGNGPDALTRVRMVGNDLQLDPGMGTCGKEGQSVPVGVGLPTIRIDDITVGGTKG
jgi:TldD protein